MAPTVNKRFLVTGAGGFVGSNVVRHLLTQTPHHVTAVTSRTAPELEQIVGVDAALSPVPLRVAPATTLLDSEAIFEVDVVINAGFPWNRGGKALAEGLKFHQGLFQQAAGAPLERFVNVSSQSVYAKDRTKPASEYSPVDCDSPYSTAKYALELMAGVLIPRETLINARLSSLIGPGYDIRLVNRFIDQALRGEPIVIDDPSLVFDFMDIEDAARALILLGEAESAPPAGNVVNVGAEQSLSLTYIASTVANLVETAGFPRPQITVPAETSEDETEAPMAPRGMATAPLRDLYGFSPAVDFRTSVERILAAKLQRKKPKP